MIQVYHNPQCSKSTECLAFIENSGVAYELIDYIRDTPTALELQKIITKLGISPIELVRQKEPLWTEKSEGRALTDSEIIRILVQNPILIERPIVISGDKAVIARPPEKAAMIIK